MIQHYRALADDPRISAFARAIGKTVRPGEVVADVGCGLGIYTVLACRAGAARVLSVEAGPILEIAREVVRDNRCQDRVRFLAGHSTELEPPERANVVLFEDYRLGLITPPVRRVVDDLCARWLAEGGALLPARARQWLAPVEDPAGRAEIDRFAGRGEAVAGVSLAPTRARAFCEPTSRRLDAGALLADPVLVREVQLVSAQVAFETNAELTVRRDGTLHGLLVWMDFELAGEWLSNAPGAPESAWRPLEFSVEPALSVRAGQRIRCRLQGAPFGDEVVHRWSVELDGRVISAHSLDSLPLARGSVLR